MNSLRVKDLLQQGRAIWGDDKLTLEQIIVRLGVSMGDLSRWARGSEKDVATHTRDEIEKEMGNIIFSCIRWCDDLGLDPDKCIDRAIKAQRAFAANNRTR